MNATLEYNGHTVTLTDNWQFRIAGPAIETDGHDRHKTIFDSLAEAKARIDTRVKQTDRQQREKLDIPMLNEHGDPVTITGLHAVHYGPLGVGNTSRLFPPDPTVKALLIERETLSRKHRQICLLLNGCTVSAKPAFARSYDDALDELQRGIERATAAIARLKHTAP